MAGVARREMCGAPRTGEQIADDPRIAALSFAGDIGALIGLYHVASARYADMVVTLTIIQRFVTDSSNELVAAAQADERAIDKLVDRSVFTEQSQRDAMVCLDVGYAYGNGGITPDCAPFPDDEIAMYRLFEPCNHIRWCSGAFRPDVLRPYLQYVWGQSVRVLVTEFAPNAWRHRGMVRMSHRNALWALAHKYAELAVGEPPLEALAIPFSDITPAIVDRLEQYVQTHAPESWSRWTTMYTERDCEFSPWHMVWWYMSDDIPDEIRKDPTSIHGAPYGLRKPRTNQNEPRDIKIDFDVAQIESIEPS